MWLLARHLIMRYMRLDRVLLGLHWKIRSCADRTAASDHANTPRRGSPALSAPAAADKQE